MQAVDEWKVSVAVPVPDKPSIAGITLGKLNWVGAAKVCTPSTEVPVEESSDATTSIETPVAAEDTGSPVPMQAPSWHLSCFVHGFPSSHGVSLAAFASVGHVGLAPSQFSATSQAPTAGRHTVDAGRNASGGQAALVPEQISATSQRPAG